MARPVGLDVVLAAVEHLTPARALDLGCGSGELALALAERGWSVAALDRNPDAIERTRHRFAEAGHGVELIEADMTSYDSGEFELVVNSYALPPESLRADALAVCARAVAPGGTLVIVEWERSMAERMPMLRADDLVTLEELRGAFAGFLVRVAERVTVPGEGGEVDGTSVLFVAERAEG